MLCRIEPGVPVIPRPGRQKPQQPQDLACRRSCLVLNRPSSDLGLRASMPSPRLGDVPHDPIIESATRQVEAVRNCLSGVTYERFLERYVGHCGAFLALVICAALLTFPAGGGDLKVKDGIFTGERLTFTVPKSAGITLSVDNEQLASGTSDQQTMLCLGAVEPGQTILLYLTRHPGIPKDTDLTKYVEAIEASGKGNFSAFSRSGQTNVDKTTTRGDYDVKSGDDEYRAIYLFHKTADGKFYALAILTKKSAWLSKRGDVEKIVKSFGEAK